MSFRAMLSHRATVKRLNSVGVDGAPTYTWSDVATGVRCFVDLSFMRHGKDVGWTPEAGRPSDRSGVFFCLPTVALKPGDRVRVTTRSGRLIGTFEVEGAVDHVMGGPFGKKAGEVHHLEVSVVEVAQALAGP